MIGFITWLRCLAAMLITNAHYTGIYPIDMIANGGLIGDIVFFCVSGYCLTNTHLGFIKWYGKRLSRILPVVILISIIFLMIGQYDFSVYASGTQNTLLYQAFSLMGIAYPKWLSWFVYPTYYHFVASILVLYVPYFFLLKNEHTRKHLLRVMAVIAVLYFAVYLCFYDKSYYHIDTVREPFIRFLFLESMILGAWFRLNDTKLRNTGKPFVYAVGMMVLFVIYFASKILLSNGWIAQMQIANQVIIFVLLFFIMRWFSSIDKYLEKAPKRLFKVVDLIAKLTLEIYLVQYVLIDVIRKLDLFFPFNWIVLTGVIAVVALILHMVVEFVTKVAESGLAKMKEKYRKDKV